RDDHGKSESYAGVEIAKAVYCRNRQRPPHRAGRCRWNHGRKAIELVAVALAGCTAFDVITMLRQKHHQKVTAYEVHVEADQAERPPQVFTAIRLRHVLTGFGLNKTAVEQAIQLSEEKYCSVGAMLKEKAALETVYEIHEEPSSWLQSVSNTERVSA